ncbi:MAG: Ig-like domain-containing protein [Bacteroidetes bacterium]|nr:Ig-like domain-containing protein [Bacteroidota bacterium]
MKKLFLNIFFFISLTGFVISQNQPPTISNITTKTINEDANTGVINFTVSDDLTAVGSLTLTGSSGDVTIVPNENIVFGGSGANRTVTVTPAANQNSSNGIVITVTVSDGTLTAFDNFLVVINPVNDIPTISPPANQTINEDAAGGTGSLAFTIGDVEHPDGLTVTSSSSNTTIIPLSGIVLGGGSGTNRTITVTPAANQFTTSPVTITLTVTDPNDATTNGTMTITILAVNDVPSFTKGANVEVLQNSSAYSQAWGTSLSTGPSNESSQVLSFTVTNNANALFSVQPAVSASGVLTFTPATGQTGTATVTVSVQDDGGTANGGTNTSASQTFTILIAAVNQVPTINVISNITILEDAGVQTVNMAGISRGVGDASAQTITITATSNSTSIVGNPTVTYTSENATGSLAVTPAANTNTSSGPVTITVRVQDNGGVLFNGIDTVKTTFQVNITAVNDEPSFTKGANVTVMQNSSAYSLAWATNLSRGGGSDEDSQALTFTVTNNANTLFSVQPAVNASGVLAFTPATNQVGTATVTLSIQDDGGTANSGNNSSANQTFTITIAQVNQEPTIDNLSTLTILEDAAQQTVNLNGIKSNGSNLAWETNQALTVTATSSNTTIIPDPTVTYNSAATTGSLAYTPNANQYGTVTISVTVTDNGGTANSGDDAITKTFTVTVTNVNDIPSYTAGGAQTILEDAGGQSVSWATNLNKGTNEASQILSFVIQNNTNTALFSAGPVIDASGTLTYTTATNKVGVATVTVYLQDDGGTANSGVDNTSDDPKSFTITVTGVNDEPIINSVSDISVDEDASAQTISLSGIGAGGGTDENSQTLALSITSSNTNIIPTPTISYASANPTGTINFTPAADQFTSGTPVVLTVTLTDNGGTANSGDDTKVITINVTVTSVNDQPTLADISNPTAVLEDAGGNITVNLSGIGSGAANETQTLSVTATSSDAAVIPNPTVIYTSANNTGSLTLTPQADQNGTITITVTVSDGGSTNSSISKTFQVTITPVNDSPSFTKGANQTVLEDVTTQTISSWATNIKKGPTSSSITNENLQTLNFVISTNTNTALFVEQPAISATGDLTFRPDLNKNGSATITAYLDDNGGTANGGDNSTSDAPITFTITVTAVNDEPTLTKPVDITIDEDAVTQTVNLAGIGVGGGSDEVGQFLIVSATSNTTTIIPTPTITSYTSPNATGTLTFSPVANKNTSGISPIVLTVRVTDDGGTANSGDDVVEKTFNVTINSVNDAPTYVAISDSTIFENLATGTDIGTLSSTDPDGDVNFTYSLVSGAGSNDNASFQIVGDKLKSNAIYNYEVKSSYTIRVQTLDQGALSFQRIIPITIKDANDTPTNIAINDSTILENLPTNTTIGTLSSTDEDAGQSYTYTFVTGTGSDNNSSFTITGDQLKSNAVFDYEVKSNYTIRVRTTDSGTPAKFFERAITVVIENDNDAPTWIAIDDSTVAENEVVGTKVGILSTTDADVGQTHTYTFVAGTGADDNAKFTIAGDQLKTNEVFNFEVKSSYTVRIRTTDNGTPGKTFDRAIPITIDNVNDTPTWITISDSSIAENEPDDIVIGTLSTTDEDANQSFTYTLVTGLGSDDNASFQILNDKLKAKESYNYEAKNQYTIRIRTTDSGTPAKFFERAVTVLIEDVNEQPVLVYPESSSVRIAISNTLKWRKVLGAIDYRMEIYEQPHTATTIDTTLTPFFSGDITGGDTVKAITNFKNYKKYFWRVRSRDNRNNISFWSFVWNFRTLIGAPIHLSPTDKKLWVKVRDTLQWKDTAKVATRYDLQISQTSGFTTGVRDVADIDSSLKIHYYDSLTTNLTYYWKMRARNLTDTSLWSTAWEFRVVPRKPQVDSVVVAKNQFNFASDSLRILYYPNGDLGDTASLVLEYSLNNGSTWFATTNILVTKEKFAISSIPTLMGWLSKKDFSFIENDSVKLRVTLIGIGGTGNPTASSVFSLDNNPPAFSGITSAFAETTGNAITITWLKGTDKNSPLRYYIYYVQTDSTLIDYNSPRDSIIDDSPTTHTKTITGFQNYKKYFLALRARDRADNFDKNEILKRATPSKPVRLLSVTTPQKIVKDSVYIPFLVNAANDDTITFVGEFSKNDGVSWFSVAQLGGRATKVSNSNFNDSVLWRTKSDGEFIESQTTKFRLTAYGLAVNSQPLTTNKFTVDNTPPMIDSIKSVVNNTQNIAGSVTVSWTKSTDMSSPTSYQLYVTETSIYNSNTPTRVFPITKPTSDIDSMWIPKLKAMTKHYFTLWYRDSLGNLDSTKVAKAKQFTTGILTDYTNDGRILTEDLAIFSNAWKTGNKNVGDISPYRGTFPVISIDNDGLIDLEDLTLFVRIWNWAFINGKGGTVNSTIAKENNANISEKSIFAGETKSLNDGRTIAIPIFASGVKSFDAMSLTLNFNTNAVKVDSFVLNTNLKKYFGESIVAMFNSHSKYGLTTTAFANLGNKDLSPEASTELGNIYISILNNNFEGNLNGAFEIYSVSKNINQNGNLSVNYSAKPVLPKNFSLEQNYPNPFNPKTNIKYSLPIESKVKIEIYNLLGEKITELVNDVLPAGNHTISWNANQSSGMYFYRIEAEAIDKSKRFVQTKKMLFLK